MAVFKTYELDFETRLYIWKYSEELVELEKMLVLDREENQAYKSLQNPKRKKEFLCTRILIKSLLGEKIKIEKNKDGKPNLKNHHAHISISHNDNFLAIIISNKREVAVDMEQLSPRIERVSARFLSETEINNLSSEHLIHHLYLHWCAKECMIKLYGKKNPDLRSELILSAFSPFQSEFYGRMTFPSGTTDCVFRQIQFEDQVLVYAFKKEVQNNHLAL